MLCDIFTSVSRHEAGIEKKLQKCLFFRHMYREITERFVVLEY
jgi:hypothetical protein